MGTDNLHHKRKAKNAKNLQRRRVRREPYKKILIVCEGEKTEPHYFEGAREYYELNTVHVEVRGDCGSDPMSIVNFAKQRFREAKEMGDSFDEIFCVFDKDGHATYRQALDALSSAAPKETYFAVPSVPCFEYWLLLHFTYSAKPYKSLPGNSSGNQVLTELKQYITDYSKGKRTIFSDLVNQLDQADGYAEQVLQANQRNGSENPSTHVHKLIRTLQELKESTS